MKKDIFGFEGIYYATTAGEIYSYDKFVKNSTNGKSGFVKTGRKMKYFKAAGYYYITLTDNYRMKRSSVHRLIAQTFIKNNFNFPQVNHKNGNKLDNSIKNLEWCTPKQNAIHARDNNLLKCTKLNKKSVLEIRSLLKKGISQTRISKMFYVTQASISEIHLNKTWKDL